MTWIWPIGYSLQTLDIMSCREESKTKWRHESPPVSIAAPFWWPSMIKHGKFQCTLIKFSCSHAHSHIFCGCFHAPIVPLSNFNRDLHHIFRFSSWPEKPKYRIIPISPTTSSTLVAGVWLFHTFSSVERTKKYKTMDFGASLPGAESEFLFINCFTLGNLLDLSVLHL